MTIKTTACATAIALVCGTACFGVPVAAQGILLPFRTEMPSAYSQDIVYDRRRRDQSAAASSYPRARRRRSPPCGVAHHG